MEQNMETKPKMHEAWDNFIDQITKDCDSHYLGATEAKIIWNIGFHAWKVIWERNEELRKLSE